MVSELSQEAIDLAKRLERVTAHAYGREMPAIELLSKLSDESLGEMVDDLLEDGLQEGWAEK